MTGPELEGQLRRLMEAGIELVPVAMAGHYVLARGEFACLVEKRDGGFGAIGSPCKVVDGAFAVVTWEGERAWFVGKGARAEAAPGEIAAFRALAADLKAALQDG